MRVDLIRHGQVPGNLEARYVGTTDEHLTEAGRAQAQEKKMERPDLVAVSPRIRCIETAAILYPGMEPFVVEELAECDFGAFEYMNYKELNGNIDYQLWIDSEGLIGFPGGEDRAAFCRRSVIGFRKALAEAERRGASHLAIVAHGGTIMAVLCELSEPSGDYFGWQCKNLEGYTFEWDGIARRPEKI